MLLSYIIPLYNASSSIASCLDCIYAEGSAEVEYEVIVIDDGSTDDGANIVSHYGSVHTNLHLFKQANKGAAEARNRGLGVATGQWIRFVDADDRIIPFTKSITEILQENCNADLLTFNYVSLSRKGKGYADHYSSVQDITGIDILRQQRMYLWDKIFSRRLIGTHRFVSGTANQEDMFFCIQTLPDAIHVTTIPENGYLYDCSSMVSTTRSSTPKQWVRNYKDSVVIQGLIKKLVEALPPGEQRDVIENILHEAVINHFYIILRMYSYRRVLRAMRDYGRIGLYPLGFCQNPQKNLFASLANHPWLLRLMARIRWGKIVV